MQVVIVGASFAGLACAIDVRKRYPEAHIILVDREMDALHAPNAVNAYLKGELRQLEEAQVSLWQEAQASQLDWRLGYSLIAVSPDRQVVSVSCQQEIEELTYDYLVLAMGAQQANHLADESALPALLTFKSSREVRESLAKLATATSVIVVGAGQLGLECLDALAQRELDLRLIEAQALPLAKHVDKDMATSLMTSLQEQGMPCHFGETVEAITRDAASGQLLVTTTKDTYTADHVVLATNFSPNNQVLDNQFDQYPDGSLVVDRYLRTSHPKVFAVGDLISLPVAYFGWAYMPMISNALLTGRLAAINLLEPCVPLDQSQRWVGSRIFEQEIISLGMTEREASLWESVQSVTKELEQKNLKLKLLMSTQHQLLGAQMMGATISSSLVDLLALAIKGGWSVETLLTYKGLHQLSDSCLRTLLYEALVDLLNQEVTDEN